MHTVRKFILNVKLKIMEPKKKRKADINRYRGMFFSIGLIISLGLTISAFKWRTEVVPVIGCSFDLQEDGIEIMDIPPTDISPPPPPPKAIKIVEVKNEEDISEIDILDNTIEVDDSIPEPTAPESIEIAPEAPFDIVENMPTPVGGYAAFYKFLSKNLRYPTQAKRMGIEGKVFMQFVIDKDGSITDAQVIKGIGAGCDEEALRAINKHPKWNAGKQRGRAVKVRMVVPIVFQLN